jgi:hypothetical protein
MNAAWAEVYEAWSGSESKPPGVDDIRSALRTKVMYGECDRGLKNFA